MTYRLAICTLTVFALGLISPLCGQSSDIKSSSKITTVSAMRVRKEPQVTAPEVARLKLGTVVNVVSRSPNQDSVGGKTDYWYQVSLPNGETGWLFGGLLVDYVANQRQQLLSQIIEARLKAENTDFNDRQEIYNLAARATTEAKDVNTRAEFELLTLQALAYWAETLPNDETSKTSYREWHKLHGAKVVPNEFAGGYNLRSELLWSLETKYHALPISDRIAWAAAENPQPSDCEGDEVCHFFVFSPAIKYLNLHPNGAHAVEALNSLNEVLTDEVIKTANSKGGDQYVVEQRTELKKMLASLRLALAKTSAVEKRELLKKLERITAAR